MLPFAHTKSILASRISVCWLTRNLSLCHILNTPLHFHKYKYYIINAITEIGHGTFNTFPCSFLALTKPCLVIHKMKLLSFDPVPWGPLLQGLPRPPVTDEEDFHMWMIGARGSAVG